MMKKFAAISPDCILSDWFIVSDGQHRALMRRL